MAKRNDKDKAKKILIIILIASIFLVLGIFVANKAYTRYKQAETLHQADEERERIKAEREAQKTPLPTPKPTVDPQTYDIPVVGMAEANINNTAYPRKLYKSLEYFDGKTTTRYYSDGKGTQRDPKYLIVVCTDGIVTQVVDRRSNPITDVPEGSISKKSGGNSGSQKKDDYYGDAEEFYYDHVDEFDSFDDAEEYYYEHYGK